MKTIIWTPIRLLGDGLARCLKATEDFADAVVATDIAAVREIIAAQGADMILIDVTQPVDLDEIRALAAEHPNSVLIALGPNEQRQEIIRCGRAGFAGYVNRDCAIEDVFNAMRDAVSGRLDCPPEISNGLLRALFRADRTTDPPPQGEPLTRREGEVLQLIGRGLTNKEIARELNLSVATVKHHVHNVLDKLRLPRRAYAMRRLREQPWLAS